LFFLEAEGQGGGGGDQCVPLLLVKVSKHTLIKKKRKFSSYIRKFRGIGYKVIHD
jgi:hypothetical protein